MDLNEISNLKELKAEQKRLKREAEIAKSYLAIRTDTTLHRSKQIIADKLSWGAVLGSAVNFTTQSLLRPSQQSMLTSSASSTQNETSSWLESFQTGLALVDAKQADKWLDIVKLLMSLFKK